MVPRMPIKRRQGEELSRCLYCQVKLTKHNSSPSMMKHRRYSCRKCWASRQKRYSESAKARDPKYLAKKKAKVAARQAGWTEERRERERRRAYGSWIVRKYGITLAQYDYLLKEQGGVCAICRCDKPNGKGAWHIDHCHRTGAVRGILCSKCNFVVGLCGDNPSILSAAATYLHREDHKQEAREDLNGKRF